MTPSRNWPQVGELAQTIGERAPPVTTALEGETLALHFDDDATGLARFLPNGWLEWSEDGGKSDRVRCRTFELRPRIFLADFIDPGRPAATRTLVIDRESGSALEILALMPSAEEVDQPLFKRAQNGRRLTAVTALVRRAGIGRPPSGSFAATAELVGQHRTYRYSPVDVYQHIYISADRYSWQCLDGGEKGLADTDETLHFKIADGLVLFIWLEKIIPTCGMVAIDLTAGRSSGKIFGYSSADLSQLTNVAVGAVIIDAPIGVTG